MTLCIFLYNRRAPLKIGIKEKGLHKTGNEELGGCVCPRSGPYAKKYTTGKYFQGLISNNVDTDL